MRYLENVGVVTLVCGEEHQVMGDVLIVWWLAAVCLQKEARATLHLTLALISYCRFVVIQRWGSASCTPVALPCRIPD
jgi:hypothetical protein